MKCRTSMNNSGINPSISVVNISCWNGIFKRIAHEWHHQWILNYVHVLVPIYQWFTPPFFCQTRHGCNDQNYSIPWNIFIFNHLHIVFKRIQRDVVSEKKIISISISTFFWGKFSPLHDPKNSSTTMQKKKKN